MQNEALSRGDDTSERRFDLDSFALLDRSDLLDPFVPPKWDELLDGLDALKDAKASVCSRGECSPKCLMFKRLILHSIFCAIVPPSRCNKCQEYLLFVFLHAWMCREQRKTCPIDNCRMVRSHVLECRRSDCSIVACRNFRDCLMRKDNDAISTSGARTLTEALPSETEVLSTGHEGPTELELFIKLSCDAMCHAYVSSSCDSSCKYGSLCLWYRKYFQHFQDCKIKDGGRCLMCRRALNFMHRVQHAQRENSVSCNCE